MAGGKRRLSAAAEGNGHFRVRHRLDVHGAACIGQPERRLVLVRVHPVIHVDAVLVVSPAAPVKADGDRIAPAEGIV